MAVGAVSAAPAVTATAAPSEGTEVVVPTGDTWGLDVAGGNLSTVERAPNGEKYVTNRTLLADGTVGPLSWRGYAGTFANGQHAERVPCDAPGGGCVPLRASGDGSVGYFSMQENGAQRAQIWLSENSYHGTEPSVTGGRFTDLSGRFYAHEAASTGKQYVDAVPRYVIDTERITRSRTAAALWGTRLWAPGSGNGVVTSYDLKTRRTVTTVSTGAPCTVKELQVMGRWLYWNCGPSGAAGVYDLTAKKKITVDSGPALLGDGYLVRHDRTAGKLLLTDFHTGTALAPRAVADLAAGTTADQRRLSWSVDRFGGGIAYAGPDHAVHIVPSGVPTQALAAIESNVNKDHLDIGEEDHGWYSSWQLNRAATWTFTVKNAAGRAVRTLSGEGGAGVVVRWDGRTDGGIDVSNGKYTWTLSAKPANGQGAAVTKSGTVTVTGARPAPHDMVGKDGHGDLLTMNSSGSFTYQHGTGRGGFSGRTSASGWPTGTIAVPFGDANRNGRNETLVRTVSGELRSYRTEGGALRTSTPYTRIGAGWNAYDNLVSPGDLNGDGLPDLLARKISTGELFAYPGRSNGTLGARTRIGGGWTPYRIIAAGDLDGDGTGDVVARHTDGTLYRYDGAGNGRLKARTTLFRNWGNSYNAILGAGDITGDGRSDLVARDTSGNLYRYDGAAGGSFGPRVKIATGWNVYKGVF
ncbi:FG-GAP-like repeat-containing protein [Streptomyces sp. NPDC046939]|uniref:FG-GAP-like repeat-containing protein n=1 Tax=Streptomyces sp. NPDC046939 TaxID=3155376 RepID=UPI0033CBA842